MDYDKEWRCTRESAEILDKTQRQGYYIRANTSAEAAKIMQQKFPYENFTVDFHKFVAPLTKYSIAKEYDNGS
jgi:hypothetical protein